MPDETTPNGGQSQDDLPQKQEAGKTEEKGKVEAPASLSQEAQEYIQKQIDLRNTYIDFAQKQMKSDREFLKFWGTVLAKVGAIILALVSTVVTIIVIGATYAGYDSMERTSAKVKQDVEDSIESQKRTLRKAVDENFEQAAKTVRQRVDQELQTERITRIIEEQARKYTDRKVAEIVETKVQVAVDASPMLRVQQLTNTYKNGGKGARKALEDLVDIIHDLTVPANVRTAAGSTVSSAREDKRLAHVAWERVDYTLTARVDEAAMRRGVAVKDFRDVKRALESGVDRDRYTSLTILAENSRFPPETRGVIIKIISGDELPMAELAVQLLNRFLRGALEDKPHDRLPKQEFSLPSDFPSLRRFLDQYESLILQ